MNKLRNAFQAAVGKLAAYTEKMAAIHQLASIEKTILAGKSYIMHDIRMRATVTEAGIFTVRKDAAIPAQGKWSRMFNVAAPGKFHVAEIDRLSAMIGETVEKLKNGTPVADVAAAQKEINNQFQDICTKMREANKLRHENKQRFMNEYQRAYETAMGIPQGMVSPFWQGVYQKVDKVSGKLRNQFDRSGNKRTLALALLLRAIKIKQKQSARTGAPEAAPAPVEAAPQPVAAAHFGHDIH